MAELIELQRKAGDCGLRRITTSEDEAEMMSRMEGWL
jgi:hypothetical protein